MEAYKSLKEYFGADKVYPIYIETDDGVRLERALFREKQQTNPNYNELCRRFLADNLDFSDENLLDAQIEKKYINDNLKECIDSIKIDIIKEMQG